MIRHALTFDVENWYDGNLHNKEYRGPKDGRVEAETQAVLALLSECGVRATFFVLGRVAARFPALVRDLVAQGHEVASHGYDHELVYQQTPERFLTDLIRSRSLLEDLAGQQVRGYRAPSWSMTAATMTWAPAAVARAGYQYDSSVFPMRTPFYGIDDAPIRPWAHMLNDGGHLPEFPPAVADLAGLRIPFGGGIYWRLIPEPLLRWFLDRTSEPLVLYLHPWELNPKRVPVGNGLPFIPRMVLTTRVTSARNLLRKMLNRYTFAPIHEVYEIGRAHV